MIIIIIVIIIFIVEYDPNAMETKSRLINFNKNDKLLLWLQRRWVKVSYILQWCNLTYKIPTLKYIEQNWLWYHNDYHNAKFWFHL